jgi:predicted nucleotidyltransferase
VREDDASFGLPAATLDAMRAVLSRHPGVHRAVIYGSRAKGSHRPGSDIDLALFGDGLTASDLVAIDGALDALDLPYRIDLSLHADIDDPALRSHIERVGRVFHEAGAVPARD